ncbi:MAG: hypothetical protein DWQ36_05290 [Acidobacteria bacterium]|nr:MAG: hypothetical protein DWQ30_12780 [Acidobacteriota bacterium]REK10056.1 MAG: hypothetical protein DWQ36_05290 [Acidobacteriota bacterium]
MTPREAHVPRPSYLAAITLLAVLVATAVPVAAQPTADDLAERLSDVVTSQLSSAGVNLTESAAARLDSAARKGARKLVRDGADEAEIEEAIGNAGNFAHGLVDAASARDTKRIDADLFTEVFNAFCPFYPFC